VAANAKGDKKPVEGEKKKDDKTELKPDEAGGSVEFVVIKKPAEKDVNKKNIKA